MTHERRSFTAQCECEYLLERPEGAGLLVVALHGFGSNADVMLRLARMWFPNEAIAAVQAPHPFYTSANAQEVGYCWATHLHSAESVRLHHQMLNHVLDELKWPAEKTLLLGFSQPVGMNYRFAATYPKRVGGVIGVCGGVPKNWEDGPYQTVTASLLHLARSEDEIYPPSMTSSYEERLRKRAADVTYHLLPGGHRFPSLGRPIVSAWVRERFGVEV